MYPQPNESFALYSALTTHIQKYNTWIRAQIDPHRTLHSTASTTHTLLIPAGPANGVVRYPIPQRLSNLFHISLPASTHLR